MTTEHLWVYYDPEYRPQCQHHHQAETSRQRRYPVILLLQYSQYHSQYCQLSGCWAFFLHLSCHYQLLQMSLKTVIYISETVFSQNSTRKKCSSAGNQRPVIYMYYILWHVTSILVARQCHTC